MRCCVEFKGERSRSRTDQSKADKCNINTIMAKAYRAGVTPFYDGQAEYMETLGEFNFQEAMNKLAYAKQGFEQLPIELKKRFNQNPDELMEFLKDKANADEARELGLLRPLTKEEKLAREAKALEDAKALIKANEPEPSGE